MKQVKYQVTIQLDNVAAESPYQAQRVVLQSIARLKISKTQHWRVVTSSANKSEYLCQDLDGSREPRLGYSGYIVADYSPDDFKSAAGEVKFDADNPLPVINHDPSEEATSSSAA
jgi:hypothetical protein